MDDSRLCLKTALLCVLGVSVVCFANTSRNVSTVGLTIAVSRICYGDHHQLSFPRSLLPDEGSCDKRGGFFWFYGYAAEAHAIWDSISSYLRDPSNLEPGRGALSLRNRRNSPTRTLLGAGFTILKYWP